MVHKNMVWCHNNSLLLESAISKQMWCIQRINISIWESYCLYHLVTYTHHNIEQ